MCLWPCIGWAIDKRGLDDLLAAAAAAKGKEYLEVRQRVLDLPKDALSLLLQATTNKGLNWQQRLIARICYERITRSADIMVLRSYKWSEDPQYDKSWASYITGPGPRMGKIVIPKCADLGLWYYYLEVNWKNTNEYAIEPSDSQINDLWIGWCSEALKSQPERYYLIQALIERIELDASLSEPLDVGYYEYLLRNKETNAVPVLIQRHDALFNREISGPELYPGIRDETHLTRFSEIIEFADSRQAHLIEKFIAGKPALAPLKDRLAEVRNRPAPPPSAEPPFRLNHQPPFAP
jgi:hypothetical protein